MIPKGTWIYDDIEKWKVKSGCVVPLCFSLNITNLHITGYTIQYSHGTILLFSLFLTVDIDSLKFGS